MVIQSVKLGRHGVGNHPRRRRAQGRVRDGATVALNRLMPGHTSNPHAHPHEHIAHIISGQIDFFIEDTVHHLRAGSLLVVPPNARHWGQVVGDEPVLNLDVFTPRRREYA